MKQSKSGSGIAATVQNIISGKIAELGYVLWDVEFVKEGADYFLRITIDKPEGINIDDCETVHRAIDPLLDENDPIEQAYNLEVSSPGIERELKTPEHISACLGEEVEVRLFAPIDGSKVFRGKLLGLAESGDILVDVKGAGEKAFPSDSVAKLRTVFDFGA